MGALWNNTKTAMLMASMMGLLMGLGALLIGPEAVLPALLIGGGMNIIAFFFSDKIALATMRAQQIGPQDDPTLWQMVERLSQQAGLPMPGLYLSANDAPNAFATGRSPSHSAVCVTSGLRRMLSEPELEGVIAHELAHIKHRDILISTVAAVIAGAISWLGYMALFFGGGRGRRGNPLVAILLMIFAPMGAALIQMAISRSREFEADRLAAKLVGTGRGLASALGRLDSASRRIPLKVPEAQANMFIVATLTGRDMAKLFMTHPPTEERIKRLQAMG